MGMTWDTFSQTMHNIVHIEGYDKDSLQAILADNHLPFWYDAWLSAHDTLILHTAVLRGWRDQQILTLENLNQLVVAYQYASDCAAIVGWIKMAIETTDFLGRFLEETRVQFLQTNPPSQDDMDTKEMPVIKRIEP